MYPTHAKIKRRWFRFGLPTMILAVSICAALFAIVRPTIHKHSVARRWQSVGARVWGYDSGKATGLVLQKGHQVKAEDWKEMDEVFFIGFRGRVKQEEWNYLEEMSGLITLGLEGASISDSDLPRLKRLPLLSHLYLDRTQITNAGLAHLVGLNIAHLELEGTAISDAGISHLGNLQNLKVLRLANTKVTDAGLALLRKKLPNCCVGK